MRVTVYGFDHCHGENRTYRLSRSLVCWVMISFLLTRFLKSAGCGTPGLAPLALTGRVCLSLTCMNFLFRYSSLPLWEIQKIPVPELAYNKALVVVWVTNKQKYRKFVIEELFPSWSCKLIGEWYWLKVMQNIFCIKVGSNFKTRAFFSVSKADASELYVRCFIFDGNILQNSITSLLKLSPIF